MKTKKKAQRKKAKAIPEKVKEIVSSSFHSTAEADCPSKDDRPVFCLCKTQEDGVRPMIQCDLCQDWFHFDCIGLNAVLLFIHSQEQVPENYKCPICQNRILKKEKRVTKKKDKKRHVRKEEECPKDKRVLITPLRLLLSAAEKCNRECMAKKENVRPALNHNILSLSESADSNSSNTMKCLNGNENSSGINALKRPVPRYLFSGVNQTGLLEYSK